MGSYDRFSALKNVCGQTWNKAAVQLLQAQSADIQYGLVVSDLRGYILQLLLRKGSTEYTVYRVNGLMTCVLISINYRQIISQLSFLDI